jgi:hypothetical protein
MWSVSIGMVSALGGVALEFFLLPAFIDFFDVITSIS